MFAMNYTESFFLFLVLWSELSASEFMKNRTEVIPISRCPEFGDPGKGVITEVLVVGDKEVLHVECEPGHDLMGPPKILCVDGHWEHVQKPQCSKRCPSPPFLRNAEVRFEGMQDSEKTYRQGSRATYNCGEGFHLSPPSSKIRICKDGYWTGPQGRCIANGCQMPPEIAYGYYVLESAREDDSMAHVSVGQRAHYNCNLGYILTGPASLQCLDSGDWSPRLPPHCTPANSESGHQTTGNMSMIFSDESSFTLFPTSGRVYFWRTPKEAYSLAWLVWFQQWNMGEVL